MPEPSSDSRNGLVLGIGAYIAWGLLPLYLKLIEVIPALQVLAHRVLWSLLLLIAIVLILKRGAAIRAAARGRTLVMLVASASMIALNWYIYIWSVQNGHVLEASLGYFINPLVNVALGVAILGEKIRRLQWVAIGFAVAGVVIMAASGGGTLWISITLALSFSTYGLLRKVVAIDALGGLTVETLILAPCSIAVLMIAARSGHAGFGQSRSLDLLLILSGVVTAIPLLMFAAAARKMQYATLGLLQYIAPTLQLSEAVLVFGEPMHPIALVSFALIWTALGLYASDSIRAARQPRLATG